MIDSTENEIEGLPVDGECSEPALSSGEGRGEFWEEVIEEGVDGGVLDGEGLPLEGEL